MPFAMEDWNTLYYSNFPFYLECTRVLMKWKLNWVKTKTLNNLRIVGVELEARTGTLSNDMANNIQSKRSQTISWMKWMGLRISSLSSEDELFSYVNIVNSMRKPPTLQ